MTDRDEASDLLEMKCANAMCDNMIFISGASDLSIKEIKMSCGKCQLVSTYKEKSEKATYVRKIQDGQLRLDESLQKIPAEKKRR